MKRSGTTHRFVAVVVQIFIVFIKTRPHPTYPLLKSLRCSVVSTCSSKTKLSKRATDGQCKRLKTDPGR